jgi:hypothetical protein
MHYLFFKVAPKDIAMIKALLEAYENIVQVSTIDENTGKIQISMTRDCVDDVLGILEDLQQRFTMIPLDEDSSKSQGKY